MASTSRWWITASEAITSLTLITLRWVWLCKTHFKVFMAETVLTATPLYFPPFFSVTVKSCVQAENWEPRCNFYDICEFWCNQRMNPCDQDSRQIPCPVISKALMKNTKGRQIFGGICLINKLDLASWHKTKKILLPKKQRALIVIIRNYTYLKPKI